MRARCKSAAQLDRATLEGFALAFAGFSLGWGGAVATIVSRRGGRVQGLLYRIDRQDLAVLDRFEGHPFVYERAMKVVADEYGRRRRAYVYYLPSGRHDGGTPAEAYLGVIALAYAWLGFDTAPLARAADGAASSGTPRAPGRTRVFVYGTLIAGQPNHRLLAGAAFLGSAKTQPRFTLHDYGAFPALVRGGTSSVVGEVYDVDPHTLAELDRLEGHPHFYRRTRLRLLDGRAVQAYVLPRSDVVGCPIIASGSWREPRKDNRS